MGIETSWVSTGYGQTRTPLSVCLLHSNQHWSNEKRNGERKEEWKRNTQQADCRYHSNRQATLYRNCRHLISSVFVYRRDEGGVDVLTQDIKIYHTNNNISIHHLIHPPPPSSTNQKPFWGTLIVMQWRYITILPRVRAATGKSSMTRALCNKAHELMPKKYFWPIYCMLCQNVDDCIHLVFSALKWNASKQSCWVKSSLETALLC